MHLQKEKRNQIDIAHIPTHSGYLSECVQMKSNDHLKPFYWFILTGKTVVALKTEKKRGATLNKTPLNERKTRVKLCVQHFDA